MAWRFQASKFKNTTPKVPKKEDTIFDVPVGNLSCTNNGIQVSASWMAFHIEGEGGKLGVLPIGAKGRHLRQDLGIVCAHAEQVSDFGFMNYDDDVLVTCSRDEKIKVWRLSEQTQAVEAEIDVGSAFMECLSSHTTAANILALGSIGSAFVADVDAQKIVTELTGINDKCQSLAWSEDGKLLAVSGDKGREILIYDPRRGAEPVERLAGHAGMGREARVLYCGDQLLSTGFTNKRVQEVRLFDAAPGKTEPVHVQEFVSTTGVLIPHYDPDTKLVFLSGKGTNKLFMMELQARQPIMSSVYEMTLHDQTLGAAVGSKRRLSVMDGEVDVYYQLTKSTILPVPCIVPRRTYRDFHADLFPETRGGEPGCSAAAWLSGDNNEPAKMSLAPEGKQSPPPQEPTPRAPATAVVAPTVKPAEQQPMPILKKAQWKSGEVDEPTPNREQEKTPEVKELDYSSPVGQQTPSAYTTSTQGARSTTTTSPLDTIVSKVPNGSTSATTTTTTNGGSTVQSSTEAAAKDVKLRPIGASNRVRPISARVRPKSCVVGQITSKFRHVETISGTKAHKVFTNLRNVNTRLPPDSNGCCASGQFVAVPLSGPAGIIGIYNVDEPTKLDDGVMDGIFNKAQVTDLQWNPFDDSQLAVGTDCGVVNIWQLKVDDGPRSEMLPAMTLKIGGEKIVVLRWHPLAAGLLTIALSNNTIELWNVPSGRLLHRISSHSGGILSMAWSADGRRLASVGKDAALFIHEPNVAEDKIYHREKVLESTRAARVLFACDDRLIIVVGLTKSSSRQIQLYDATTFDLRPVYSQQIDSATQPLVPHYDYDTNILFLSGKGDRIVNMFEVTYDSPYLLPLTNYVAAAGAQTIAFHNKKRCNVMAVEFQIGWRLTEKTLEQLTFRVPRVKKDAFQSDLFPDALITWEPVTTADEWMAGADVAPLFRSLKPDGVYATCTQTAPATSTAASTTTTRSSVVDTPSPPTRLSAGADQPWRDGEDARKKMADAWSAKIGVDTRLEQDSMQGVDEKEWE